MSTATNRAIVAETFHWLSWRCDCCGTVNRVAVRLLRAGPLPIWQTAPAAHCRRCGAVHETHDLKREKPR